MISSILCSNMVGWPQMQFQGVNILIDVCEADFWDITCCFGHIVSQSFFSILVISNESWSKAINLEAGGNINMDDVELFHSCDLLSPSRTKSPCDKDISRPYQGHGFQRIWRHAFSKNILNYWFISRVLLAFVHETTRTFTSILNTTLFVFEWWWFFYVAACSP